MQVAIAAHARGFSLLGWYVFKDVVWCVTYPMTVHMS
jgi:hypothetical protein